MTKEKPKKLTPRQQRFVEEYLIDLNGTQAAIRAGYSAKSAGRQALELLQKTLIVSAVAQAQKGRSERLQLSADMVAQELWKLYQNTSVLVPKEDFMGEPLRDSNGEQVFKPLDGQVAVSALDKLMKHLGGYTADNKREVDGELSFMWKPFTEEDKKEK